MNPSQAVAATMRQVHRLKIANDAGQRKRPFGRSGSADQLLQ